MTEDHFREPRARLADRLGELWQAAGTPTLDAVARAAQGARTPSTAKLTGKKISAWKTGANVPQSLTELKSVIRVLIQYARGTGLEAADSELLDTEQWSRWWTEARNSSPLRPDAKPPALGQVIDQKLDPFDLEVHHAISDESSEFTLALPSYIERDHDRRLRVLVDRAQTQSTLVVLVGGSSTGKTRSCWEAVQRLAGWRLWHPVNPSRPEALLDAFDKGLLSPKTVLWLNEMQYYFDYPEFRLGERVAAGIRELLRDPARAPVLVLGTLWPEYWDALTRPPGIGEGDSNAQCRELLNGRKIKVPDTFEETDIARLPDAVKTDGRVIQALSRPDKRVTQFLAGAFELLSRYETAPAAPRSLIDVAIDASRFRFGSMVPQALLRDAAPGYLSDYEWNELGDDWLAKALTYVQRPCLGVSGPLARIRSRSSNLSAEEPLYRLADFLEDNGRRFRQFIMPPETFWNAIADCAGSSETLIDLAYELQYRGRYKNAARIYLMAADAGEINGLLYLADNRRGVGDDRAAEAVLKIAADRGSLLAYIDLAELRAEAGDIEAAKRIFRDVLVDHSIESEDRSVAWHRLLDLCEDTGDIRTARHWLKQAAKKGDISAIDELVRLDRKGRDSETMLELRKTALEVRRASRQLEQSHRNLIKHALADTKSFAWALQYFAEIMEEEKATGRSTSALIMLGRLHAAHGSHDIAWAIFLKAINVLDDPYEYGVIPALVELVKILKRSGDSGTASRLWQYGLELDGSIANAWNVLDQLPSASH